MVTPWRTEEEESQAPVILSRDVAASLTARQLDTIGKEKVKLEYKTKAFLVLVDSDKHDWGIVEDSLDDLLWVPGKGEPVGTWSRPSYDNLIHLSLGTAISILQDRSTQTFAKYAEERRQAKAGGRKSSKRAKTTVEPIPESVPELSVDDKLKFNSLRARLGRVK